METLLLISTHRDVVHRSTKECKTSLLSINPYIVGIDFGKLSIVKLEYQTLFKICIYLKVSVIVHQKLLQKLS